MSAATSSRSCATSSRSRSRRRASASARTCRRSAQLAAEERVLDALVGAERQRRDHGTRSAASCAPASSTTRKSRSRRRSSGGMPMFEIPGMPGAQMGAISIGDIFRQARRRPHQDAAADGCGFARDSGCRRIRQAARHRSAGAGGDQCGREQRHRVPRRDRQDLRARRPHRRRRLARGRAARPVAADRGHHRLDQARRGEDRPHPVHRLRRVPHRKAVRPVAGAAGPAADPRRAAAADPRRFAPHPDRAGGLADQAVCRADADRGRDARIHRRRHRRASPTSRSRSTRRSRTSARGGCRR